MSRLKRLNENLIDCVLTFKSRLLDWQQQTHGQKKQLRHERVLDEQTLQGKLKKQQQILEHELAMLQTQQKTELAILRIKSKQDIQDYREYLASIDQLKATIKSRYQHLPEPLAFTFHHHAKQLLNQMWEARDLQQKMNSELKLIQFMTHIDDEIRSLQSASDSEETPQKTLEFLKK